MIYEIRSSLFLCAKKHLMFSFARHLGSTMKTATVRDLRGHQLLVFTLRDGFQQKVLRMCCKCDTLFP